jgi:hypothetical protein
MFVKGQSGNPGGRPKGLKYISDILNQLGCFDAPEELVKKMRLQLPQLSEKCTLQDAVWARVYLEALSGESWAIQLIAERTEGKVKQTNELTGADGAAITFTVTGKSEY